MASFLKKSKSRNVFGVSSFFLAFFLAMPASTNYTLKDYGFGNGGGSSSSTNYSMRSITGEVGGQQLSGANYNIGTGMIFVTQANVPAAPAFSNPSNYYDKLKIIINTSGNPSDTKYAIAISKDDFATTQYIQNDNTIGSALGLEDYQSYASWGGSSGFLVIGLLPATTYKIKAKAIQGVFTETGFGPTASAVTVNPTLTFDIDVSATDSETNPPFTINFSSLALGSVSSSSEKVWIDFSTNANSGGKVYVVGKNAGLQSATNGYKISSVSANLAAIAEGFGAQGYSVSQTSGGPLVMVSPYNQSSDTVGIVDTALREMFSSSAPITGGRGSFLLKARASSVTPSANDYSETFIMTASGNF